MAMNDRQLYSQILGISGPWKVQDVAMDLSKKEIVVEVASTAAKHKCPECGKKCSGYDSRVRRWRHLDTCQLQTIVLAKVPRVACPEHGVHQIHVPWAEPGSKLTAMFEALVIDWLRDASVDAVRDHLGLTWYQVDMVMKRAVERGLARREATPVHDIGVDETSFQKRHEYVTVVTDTTRSKVLHVSDGKSASSLSEYYESLSPEHLAAIETVSMDMSSAYISSTRKHLEDADDKIIFDKFHVAKILGAAVNKVRREENSMLKEQGDRRLVGTRYLWLSGSENVSLSNWRGHFKPLRESVLRTARAWAIKEEARRLWSYTTYGWARRGWNKWLSWANRCRLQPMIKAAATVKNHLWGILNAAVTGLSNATAESLNAGIQRLKKRACGYRSRAKFRIAILFNFGGLDLMPEGAKWD